MLVTTLDFENDTRPNEIVDAEVCEKQRLRDGHCRSGLGPVWTRFVHP